MVWPAFSSDFSVALSGYVALAVTIVVIFTVTRNAACNLQMSLCRTFGNPSILVDHVEAMGPFLNLPSTTRYMHMDCMVTLLSRSCGCSKISSYIGQASHCTVIRMRQTSSHLIP
jgi:hypothetical protein